MTPRLFLDCDGVLADFDRGAEAILRMPPQAFEARHGSREFWRRLARAEGFFDSLPLMPDARELVDQLAARN